MVYEWTDPDYFEEYVQTGQAEDMDTLVPTGRVFQLGDKYWNGFPRLLKLC